MSIDLEDRQLEQRPLDDRMSDDSAELDRGDAYDLGDVPDYRVLCSQSVASCILGVLSAATLLSYEYSLFLGILPMLGIALGVWGWWKIRSSPLEFTGGGLAKSGLAMSVLFLTTGYAIAGYVYATEVPEGYQRIDYSLLQPEKTKVDEATPTGLLSAVLKPDASQIEVPESAKALDGKRVFIKGYVYPPPGGMDRGIKQFVLCRDNGDCCFGGQPKVTDMILVTLTDPLRLDYSTRLHRLAGTFKVARGRTVEGVSDAVYQLEADYLK